MIQKNVLLGLPVHFQLFLRFGAMAQVPHLVGPDVNTRDVGLQCQLLIHYLVYELQTLRLVRVDYLRMLRVLQNDRQTVNCQQLNTQDRAG